MIGEIRDFETAQIAIQASLTGHLVLATLHTNDAASAVTRLIDMGIEPFLLSSSLLGVLGQRLVRKLCTACQGANNWGLTPKENQTSQAANQGTKGSDPNWLAESPKRLGCAACAHTGYSGRTGIFELLTTDDAMRALIHTSASEAHIREAAVAGGMKLMREDGERLVAEGMTSREELVRVTRD
jgi:general secretion pathway protein E